jgi:nucleoside-diphosphate kinase
MPDLMFAGNGHSEACQVIDGRLGRLEFGGRVSGLCTATALSLRQRALTIGKIKSCPGIRPGSLLLPLVFFGVKFMAIERTLSIIKPDAVAKNVIGKIYSRFETNGLKIVASKMAWLSPQEAGAFYAVHRERSFFKELVEFMTSGPVMIQVLEGESAIAKNRELMGATDPAKAAPGTIRADFATSIDANAVHGSDGLDTAKVEVAFFFPEMNVYAGR